ncbi:MAG: SigE family RNA polymerase sigma factor [Nocardioides sp.]|nr:SigE family RNA polymerase sigma factor [Nocardioides sp.]
MSSRDDEFSDWMLARQGAMHRTAFLVCGDRHTAEDLVQTAAAKLYLAWDRVSAQGNVDAYMRRIIINERNSLWRRPFKKRETVTDEVPESAHADGGDDPMEAERMWAAVRSLAPRQRAVIVLRYYEDLSEAAIAEILGVAPGTVKSQASKALTALRKTIGSTFDIQEQV